MQGIGYTGDKEAETSNKVTQRLAKAGSHYLSQAAETNRGASTSGAQDWGSVIETNHGVLMQQKLHALPWEKPW